MANFHGYAQDMVDALGDGFGTGNGKATQQDNEFVRTHAADGKVWAGLVFQAPGKLDEYTVTGMVTKGRVDLPKAIQSYPENKQGSSGFSGLYHEIFNFTYALLAIQEASQFVQWNPASYCVDSSDFSVEGEYGAMRRK